MTSLDGIEDGEEKNKNTLPCPDVLSILFPFGKHWVLDSHVSGRSLLPRWDSVHERIRLMTNANEIRFTERHHEPLQVHLALRHDDRSLSREADV